MAQSERVCAQKVDERSPRGLKVSVAMPATKRPEISVPSLFLRALPRRARCRDRKAVRGSTHTNLERGRRIDIPRSASVSAVSHLTSRHHYYSPPDTRSASGHHDGAIDSMLVCTRQRRSAGYTNESPLNLRLHQYPLSSREQRLSTSSLRSFQVLSMRLP